MAHYSTVEMEKCLSNYPQYRDKLFCRGFLVTDAKHIDIDKYPFYNNWTEITYKNYYIYVHKQQHIYYTERANTFIFLIGNAVNPFDMECDEQVIVEHLASIIAEGQEACIDYINKLTGNFFLGYVSEEYIFFMTDPAEMLFSAYGKIDGCLYISSHAQLVGDICHLRNSAYAKKLEAYKFFYKYGVFFPGDFTQYDEMKRVLTNHLFKYDGEKFTFQRIYPSNELVECKTDEEYRELIKNVSDILHRTMNCVAKKWEKPAISMTGGMDSKTTIAMANGLYDKFRYYSYVSMDGDKIDADAAHEIAKAVDIDHVVYTISVQDEDFKDIELVRRIIEHNNGGYCVNKNDVRKRAYFDNTDKFDVEVKSWISEIARANYYKKFGLKKMPKRLSPRNMTSMYKIFLLERALAKQTDKVFEEFIQKSSFDKMPDGYDASDMYLWEFRYSAWGGMVITSEHSYSYEIFIPFNNRLLLDLMLKAPKEKRISDVFHEDLIAYGNMKISETQITVTNWNETKKRMYIEKMYFLLSSALKNL